MGPILLKKSLILMRTHNITDKNIKCVKSLKKYKRGFAIRTWKMINLLSQTDDFIRMINSLSKTDGFIKTHKFF